MNNQPEKTSNLRDILNLKKPDSDTTQPQINLETETLVTSESKPEKISWADSSITRLIFAGGIIAIPVTIFLMIYGSAFNIKAALDNSKPVEEISVEENDNPIVNETDENLRGRIAIGKQKESIAKIEALKPKPQPEIKLEPKEIEPQSEIKVTETVVSPVPVKPIVQPRRPVVRTNNIPTRSIKQVTPKTPKIVQYDSIEDWRNLAASGSYGSPVKKGDKLNIQSVSSRLNIPSAQLVAATNEGESSAQKLSLTSAEENFLKLLDQEPEPIKQNTNQVAIAQQVKGELVTAINWVGTPQRTFIKIKEPLFDIHGKIQIDDGEILVYEIEKVNGGILQGQVVALIKEGQEIPIPKDAISVLDKKGQMLAAKYKEYKHNGNSDLLSFTLGAAQQSRDLIAQPDSSSSIISQFGQSQNTNYGNKNYPGAIVSGGATEILENRLQEVERRRNTSPITSFWKIKAATKVTLQTNFTFEI